MNDPAVKLALALSIMLGGVLAAIAFRPDPAVPRTAAPTWSELAALRNHRPPESAAATATERTAVSHSSQVGAFESAAARGPTVLTPLDNPPTVPALPSKYPGDGLGRSTGWGMPLVPPPDRAPVDTVRRMHKIEDGDTLPALAERYLGSPRRANDIFNANRDVLSNPDLLPIGVELKIPP